jgi:hypothetical protein
MVGVGDWAGGVQAEGSEVMTMPPELRMEREYFGEIFGEEREGVPRGGDRAQKRHKRSEQGSSGVWEEGLEDFMGGLLE